MISKTLYPILVLFLLLDLAYSFSQYYHQPIDGDLVVCVYPSDDYKPVLSHPLGLPVLRGQEKYGNPNRFFSHWPYYHYYRNMPLWLQSMVSPITSLYLSGALAKILIHIGLLYLLGRYASGEKNPFSARLVLAAVIVSPFFHANGLSSTIGVINWAMSYTFFYAFSLLLMAWYTLPLFEANHPSLHRPISGWYWLFSIPMAIVVALGGGINAGVGLVLVGYTVLFYFLSGLRQRKKLLDLVRQVPRSFWIFLLPLALLSIYSFILSNLNIAAEEQRHQLGLLERYSRMAIGCWRYIFHQLGIPLLILSLTINYYLINRLPNSVRQPIRQVYYWVLGFALLYLIVLPLGGYRNYRPFIVRHDTMMPVYLMLLFLFAKGSLVLWENLSAPRVKYHRIGLAVLLLFFTLIDNPGWTHNDCERAALTYISQQTEKEVILPENCLVMAWENPDQPEASYMSAELLLHWNIVDEKRFFYYPRE